MVGLYEISSLFTPLTQKSIVLLGSKHIASITDSEHIAVPKWIPMVHNGVCVTFALKT